MATPLVQMSPHGGALSVIKEDERMRKWNVVVLPQILVLKTVLIQLAQCNTKDQELLF